jgi:uncharacterized membrane protein YecN with MAPEG domain
VLYSAYTAAVLSLLLMALSLNISRLRLAHKISFGDGGIKELTLATRAHGNSLEQSLIFIVLLYFMETAPAANAQIALVLGVAFVITRIIHCTAMFTRRLLIRQIAHVATVGLQLATALIILAGG